MNRSVKSKKHFKISIRIYRNKQTKKSLVSDEANKTASS